MAYTTGRQHTGATARDRRKRMTGEPCEGAACHYPLSWLSVSGMYAIRIRQPILQKPVDSRNTDDLAAFDLSFTMHRGEVKTEVARDDRKKEQK